LVWGEHLLTMLECSRKSEAFGEMSPANLKKEKKNS
jgi:hypothetical protein